MATLYRQLRRLCRSVIHIPVVKNALIEAPLLGKLYPAWERTHPVDLSYGIETSGYVPIEEIHPDQKWASLINPYAASQPGVVRRILTTLGKVEEYTLADLGCGKGRVTIVGSEFPFREIIGVELSSDLVKIARANVETVKRKFPDRPQIEIFEANAVEFPFPPGKLVVFLYHSFGSELVAALIKHLESQLSSGNLTHLFVVYCNPVYRELFDGSAALAHWCSATIPCDPSEVGYAPYTTDKVIIWQSHVGAVASPPSETAITTDGRSQTTPVAPPQ